MKPLTIVKVTELHGMKIDKDEKKYGVLVSDETEDTVMISLLRFDDKSERSYIELSKYDIKYEVVGTLETHSKYKIYQDSPFYFKQPVNDNEEVIIANRVSEINHLHYVRMTDSILMGYNTYLDEQVSGATNKANVYYFHKVGYIDATPVFVYNSDMYIFDEAINWVSTNLSYGKNAKTKIEDNHVKLDLNFKKQETVSNE